jgi:uroporphyrin-III C-methyltransferase/precorrin-2 dehydrogenase/sirohydrochlorin ferrochelatase
MTLYPAFLDLAGRNVLLVGGGPVAGSKLDGLLAAGARVTVVAPEISSAIREQDVTLVERAFQASDLDGVWWVVAAAPPEVNRAVANAAEQRRVFVNAVDDKGAATAFLGGVVRRGQVEIAISTGGAAPALAGLLREGLDAVLPHDLDRWVEVALATRAEWKAAHVPMAERRPLLLRALEELYATRNEPASAATKVGGPGSDGRQVAAGRIKS